MKIKLGLILPTIALLITFFSGCAIESTDFVEYSLEGDISSSACALVITYTDAGNEEDRLDADCGRAVGETFNIYQHS